MATNLSLDSAPGNPQVGEAIAVVATLSPAPANAQIQFTLDGTDQGTQQADTNGQAPLEFYGGLTEGPHMVEAAFVDQLTGETGTRGIVITVAEAQNPGQQPPSPQASPAAGPDTAFAPADPTGTGVPASDSPTAERGSVAFTRVQNVDPFTGLPAADPFTGQPIALNDQGIRELIRDVFSQPAMDLSGVPQSVQNAILDVYNQRAVDFSGVPQPVQNAILDVYSPIGVSSFARPDELPGVSIGEFYGGVVADTLNNAFGDIRDTIGQSISTLGRAVQIAADSVGHGMRPVFGALQAVNGAAQFVEGVGFAVATAESGIGVVAGAAYAANGIDNFVTGIQTMLGNETHTVTFNTVRYAVQQITDNDEWAKASAETADVGIPVVGGISLGLARLSHVLAIGADVGDVSAAARVELAESSTLARETNFNTDRIEQAAIASRTGGAAGLDDWTAFTRPPRITIRYTEAMAAAPSDAVFLAKNLQMAQIEAGYLERGERLATEWAYRRAGRESMRAAGFDLTDLQAMHPLDSIAAGRYLTEGQGTTYYFGNRAVNASFGSQMANQLNHAGVDIGQPFTVELVGFPDIPVVAPPASMPNLPISRIRRYPPQ